MNVFVTGTDTGCGKTHVSAALVAAAARRGLAAAGMKPIASGATVEGGRLVNEDIETLVASSSIQLPVADVNQYLFEPPTSPHIAAAEAGASIDPERIAAAYERAARTADLVVVEGVGGWLVPLGPRLTVADLAIRLGLPVVLVVGVRLGCINHAALTAAAIAQSGLPFAGWIANVVETDLYAPAAVMDSLLEIIEAPRLGVIDWHGAASGELLDALVGRDD
ncbi:MAG: dethiobiotin synthase [Gammaproteobacteria bacterium]